MQTNLELRTLSSLEKIFPDEAPSASTWQGGTFLRNERCAFQLGWYWDAPTLENVTIETESALTPWLRLYQVDLVPANLPNFHGHDAHVLRTSPGLFPDLLRPMNNGTLTLLPEQWRSVWVEIDGTREDLPAGLHQVALCLTHSKDGVRIELGHATVILEVLPAELPAQTLLHTQWFHGDCIATLYNLETFSEPHWQRIEQFVETAVAHGINTLLTPLFTPPLDTAVGGERPTIQLVEVLVQEHSAEGNPGGTDTGCQPHYAFGFDRLLRWLKMGDRIGVRMFEMSHLFTQWGAKHAPKILGTLPDGSTTQLFGWETDAHGPTYSSFLDQFLPALIQFLGNNGYASRVLFHVSDEPGKADLDSYRHAAAKIRQHVGEIPVIDALSDFDFYQQGLIERPVAANNHIEPFLEAHTPHLWTYYCCSQTQLVANRFFCMPSARNRILATQLFKYDIEGFLHWGYNFWFARHATRPVDPYRETDAGCAFPAGDAFLVYPGKDGPETSIRLKVLAEAMQDLRALQALSARLGKTAVVALMEEGAEAPLTFAQYPREATWLLEMRERINRALAEG